jgi:hypothetical protein
MRLAAVEHASRIPGTARTTMRHGLEWRCPDCDYFEEPETRIENLTPELQAWIDEP